MRVNRSRRQGSGREAVAERSPRQSPDHRNTKRQGGRVRAASVRGNAKRQAHQGASGRAAWPGRKVHVLTQGDLTCESRPGVSRGRSSDEAMRKPGGAKGRRNDCKATSQPVPPARTARTSAAQEDGLHDRLSEPQASRWCSHLQRSGEGRAGEARGGRGTR